MLLGGRSQTGATFGLVEYICTYIAKFIELCILEVNSRMYMDRRKGHGRETLDS